MRKTGGTDVVIDFNRASNPSCAYAADVVCPLPPPENYLLHPIPAGEKMPAGDQPASRASPR